MNYTEETTTCRSCGAPITSEICPYCGCRTGLDTANANMDYPVLECKEANLNFWTVLFPLIFALGFGFGGVMTLSMAFTADKISESAGDTGFGTGTIILFSLPFLIIGIVAAVFTVLPIYRYIVIRMYGKRIEAVVYGYTDDNVLMNGRPAQVVKLLVDTPNGKRFIMYQLGNTSRPYGVNTVIDLKVYKNYFMIEKNKEKEQINW